MSRPTDGGRSDGGSTAECFEAGVNNLPGLLVDLDLELHLITAGIREILTTAVAAATNNSTRSGNKSDTTELSGMKLFRAYKHGTLDRGNLTGLQATKK